MDFNRNRTQNDICLICKSNFATKTKSHINPACFIKRVLGKRDYEEIFTISSYEAKHSVYYGSANLKNTDPERKKPQNVEDYIFCPECETKLGILEGKCCPTLENTLIEIVKGTIKIERTKLNNKYLILHNLSANLILVFFYSIIFRQTVEAYISNGVNVIDDFDLEKLRKIICKAIYLPSKEIEKITTLPDAPKLIIYTSYHLIDDITGFLTPNDIKTNPELFFAGGFDCLIYFNHSNGNNFEMATGLNINIIDQELEISFGDIPKVAIVSEAIWRKKNARFALNQSRIYMNTIATRFSKRHNVPFEISKAILYQTALEINIRTGKNMMICLNDAELYIRNIRINLH